jgi:hypothetical protein
VRLIYIDVSRKAPTKGSENRKPCVLLTVTEDAMRSELTEEFENTAAWREEKAAVQRADPRNRGAVEILRHLAATADDVPLALMSEYRAVFLRWDTSEVVRLINETLRAVGFRT